MQAKDRGGKRDSDAAHRTGDRPLQVPHNCLAYWCRGRGEGPDEERYRPPVAAGRFRRSSRRARPGRPRRLPGDGRIAAGRSGGPGPGGRRGARSCPDHPRAGRGAAGSAAGSAAAQAAQRQRRMIENQQYLALQRWWLDRMIVTSTPLREKLTLIWHGHFATAFQKVQVRRLDVPPEPAVPDPRVGELRGAHPGGGQGPGHDAVAGHRDQRGRPPERELRPGADGAVHPRHRQLQRDRRPRGGPGLHRLEPGPGDLRVRAPGTAATTAGTRPSSARPGTWTAPTWCGS